MGVVCCVDGWMDGSIDKWRGPERCCVDEGG